MIFTYQNLNWKDKPEQWGSFSDVQSGLFHNAEKIGINPADIALAMPMWNPGDQRDYSKNSLIGLGFSDCPDFSNNSLIFDGNNTKLTIDNIPDLVSGDATIIVNGNNFNQSGWRCLIELGSGSLRLGLWTHDDNIVVVCDNYAIGAVMFSAATTQLGYVHKVNIGEYTYDEGKLLDSLASRAGPTLSSIDGYIGADKVSDYDAIVNMESVLVVYKALSDAQIASLYDQKWQLWQPRVPTYYSFPEAAIPTYTPSFFQRIITMHTNLRR